MAHAVSLMASDSWAWRTCMTAAGDDHYLPMAVDSVETASDVPLAYDHHRLAADNVEMAWDRFLLAYDHHSAEVPGSVEMASDVPLAFDHRFGVTRAADNAEMAWDRVLLAYDHRSAEVPDNVGMASDVLRASAEVLHRSAVAADNVEPVAVIRALVHVRMAVDNEEMAWDRFLLAPLCRNVVAPGNEEMASGVPLAYDHRFGVTRAVGSWAQSDDTRALVVVDYLRRVAGNEVRRHGLLGPVPLNLAEEHHNRRNHHCRHGPSYHYCDALCCDERTRWRPPTPER